MKEYNSDWRVIEGSLKVGRLNKLPGCLEKEHLFEVRKMLTLENYQPDEFFVGEYPIEGVYICHKINKEDYFTVGWNEWLNKLTPSHTTGTYDESGNNNYWCETIKESIDLTEV